MSYADCSGCVGDYALKLKQTQFWAAPSLWPYGKHTHDFGAKCDAYDIPGGVGEVHIAITVSADLEGVTKYVTANFVSGTEVTPIASVKGFIDAPADGKFFAGKFGKTACSGEENIAVVRLNYDDFNALLAAGDGTVKVEVFASADVLDVCDICCESGHSWTPQACCTPSPPCACPKGVGSYTEVTLIYLDCDVIGTNTVCQTNSDCADDGLYCNGDEICDQSTNLCASAGSPCLATQQVCDEATDTCVDCDPLDLDPNIPSCEAEDGLFCNGTSRCNDDAPDFPFCEPGSSPCPAGECEEQVNACLSCMP